VSAPGSGLSGGSGNSIGSGIAGHTGYHGCIVGSTFLILISGPGSCTISTSEPAGCCGRDMSRTATPVRTAYGW
jgi:uncharacterized heparinase superfamily protein